MLSLLSKLLLLFSFSVFADDMLICEKGAISSLFEGKTTVTETSYCTNKARTRLFSENCRIKKCVAFDYPEGLNYQDFMGADGNPSFKVCRKIGGKPRIISFKSSGNWYKLDQCIFPDGSFVNTDYLAYYYFRVKNQREQRH